MFMKRRNRRLRKNLKSFRRKRVNYNKYVKDFYLESGLAYISSNIEGYYDVVDRYSVEGYEWLNSEFANFIETNAYYIPVSYPIVLEICGGHLTEKQQEAIVETVSDYYALQLGDHQFELDNNRRKSLILFFFGLISSAVVWLLQFTKVIGSIKEAILILFWFFTWEFANLAWLERRDLSMAKTDAAQLASIKVIFRDMFVDNPVDKVVAQQIIAEVIDDAELEESVE